MRPGHHNKESTSLRVAKLVSTAFSDAQRTLTAHQRATALLSTALKLSPKDFLNQFITVLNRILVVFARDVHVERLIQFISSVLTTDVFLEGNVCKATLVYLLRHSNACTPAVRFRAVQLIGTVLSTLPVDAEISDEVLDQIDKVVMDRAIDRVPRVRAAAAWALCRMQVSGNPETDDSTSVLVNMLSSDSSASVRKAAIHAVAVNSHTLSFILSRIHDVNADVRRAVFDALSKNVDPFQLGQENVIYLVRNGLQDRVKSVRDFCCERLILQSWMREACEGDLFKLVDLLGGDANETVILNVLKVVFQADDYSHLVDSLEIDVNNLTVRDVFVLRGLCEARRTDRGLDKFIPTTLDYANILRYYAVDATASKNLLELCKCVDLSDEAGRRELQNVLCTSFLSSRQVLNEIIAAAVRALQYTVSDVEACARLLCDVVRDILHVDQDQPSADADIDPDWKRIRALKICSESLRIAPLKFKANGPGMSSISTIFGNLLNMVRLEISENEEVRRLSLECIALYCLLDNSGEQLRAHIPLFMTACINDISEIQDLCLRALTDLFMLQGFPENEFSINLPHQSRSSNEEVSLLEVNSGAQAFQILLENIFPGEPTLRNLAVQCLARLLHASRLAPTGDLLRQLLIVYHCPATESEVELKQWLSVFFPSFASKSGRNLLALEDSFMPTIQELMKASDNTNFSDVSVLQIAQFIISLTSPQMQESLNRSIPEEIGRSTDMIHERLAEETLGEMIDAWDDDASIIFAKILNSFRFLCNDANKDKLYELNKLSKRAAKNSNDRRVKKLLLKFIERLDADLARFELERSELEMAT